MTKEQPAHSSLGASSASRWMACPGSVELLAKNPQLKKSSSFADEGTAAHELAEKVLNASMNAHVGIDYVKHAYVGKKFGPKKDIEVTNEMVDHVMTYVGEIVEERHKKDYKEIFIESKVDLSFIHPDMFGTNDCIVVRPFDRLTVYDFKYGAGVPVEVEDNAQMLYYALGAAHKFRYDFQTVEMVIVQPRCEHPEGPIRRCEITMAELMAFKEKLIAAVKRVHGKDAEFKAGKHCRFCDAKPICPKLREEVQAVAKADFSEPKTMVLPVPESLTDAELVKILEAADIISDWAKSVASYAHEQAKKGKVIPGYKLVNTKGHRKWILPEADTNAALRAELKIAPGDISPFFAEPKLLSPAQMEKIKVGDKKTLVKIVNSLSEAPTTGTSLVKDTNKKPGIEVKPDFEAV